jgi:hypothetical protein|tara:strand:+ start:17 stop:292 length:276 start_codon:yes stop_codon:yes gene_type:complete
MTLLVLLSCILTLVFLGTVALSLIAINKELAPIGGMSDSYLAKLRLGLRAIEKQTSHLGQIIPKVNETLESLETGLPVLAQNLSHIKKDVK